MRAEGKGDEAKRTFPVNSSISNLLGIVGGIVGSIFAAIALNLPMLVGAALTAVATLLAFSSSRKTSGRGALASLGC